MTTPTIPAKHTAAYRAGAYLHHGGPKSERELLAAVDFGSPSKVRDTLQRAIRRGWLIASANGVISCGDAADAHYRSLEPEAPKYQGQIVPPRVVDPLYGPELSRKYIPNRRGTRIGAMDNSLAAMPSKFFKEQA